MIRRHLDVLLLRHKLDIEGPSDVQSLADGRRYSLDSSNGLHPELLSREQEGRVPGVHSRVLRPSTTYRHGDQTSQDTDSVHQSVTAFDPWQRSLLGFHDQRDHGMRTDNITIIISSSNDNKTKTNPWSTLKSATITRAFQFPAIDPDADVGWSSSTDSSQVHHVRHR